MKPCDIHMPPGYDPQTAAAGTVQNCVAWKDKAVDFYANHSSAGNTWLNNTAYSNGTQHNMLATPSGDTSPTITLAGWVGDSSFNTWDLGITETSADVRSAVICGL